MTVSRSLFGLILALVLAVTSVTMAVARQYESMGTSITICADGGQTTVILDAQGNKIPFAHPCPDCVAAVAAQIFPSIATLPVRTGYHRVVLHPNHLVFTPNRLSFAPQARGPPHLM